MSASIPLHARIERFFSHRGRYGNPYREVEADATLTAPDGQMRHIPLYWDGDDRWGLRLSPDRVGQWSYRIRSSDPGLDGQSATFNVEPSDLPGGIMPMADFPHHFQRQNGQRFYFFGDTAWHLFADNPDKRLSRQSVMHYLDTRSAQGFNVVHAMLISESGWPNHAGRPFEPLSDEALNPRYFQEVDFRVQYANARGLTVGLVLSWYENPKWENDYRTFPSLEARLRYARYIAARYSAFDVYFIVVGEWDFDAPTDERKAYYAATGAQLRRHDPHGRMIGIHPSSTARWSVAEFNEYDWMSLGDYQQNYYDLHRRLLPPRVHRKPVVNAEYAYHLRDADGDGKVDKENSESLQTIRHATWDIVVGGAYIVTGFGSTYYGGCREPGPFDVDAIKNDDWEGQVQHVRRLFESLEWWRLQPADELLSCPVPRGEDIRCPRPPKVAPPRVTYWALAEEGRQYVAYARGLDVPLTLAVRPGVRYCLSLFDVRSGQLRDLGAHDGSGRIAFTPPDTQDWVLVARAM